MADLHAWTGVAASLFVLLAALTGLAITFAGSLLHVETGAFGAVSARPAGERVDVAALVAEAEAKAGDGFIPLGYLGPNAEITTPVEMIYGLAGPRDERTKVVTLDPATGDALGSFLLDETLTHWLIDLHAELLLGPIGAVLAAATGAGIVGLTVLGLILWWPTDHQAAAKARAYALDGTPTRKAWRIHSLIGLWLSVPVLLWALSGAYWSKPDWFPRSVTGEVARLPREAQSAFESSCNGDVGAIEAVDVATSRHPDARLLEAHFAAPWQLYHVLHLAYPGDADLTDGDTRVWVHASCPGIVVEASSAALGGTLKSLHSGRLLGPLRLPVLLVVASSLLTASVTGLWLWIVRSFGPKRPVRQRRITRRFLREY